MAQEGSDIIATTAFELIGVGLMALLAGANDQLGSVIVVVMAGFLIIWLLSNTAFLQKYLGKPAS